MPPADRVWRHPSELGAYGSTTVSATWSPVVVPHPGRRSAVTAGVVGLVAASLVLVLTAGTRLGSSTTVSASSQRVVPQLLAATTTALFGTQTPVAWLGISTDDDVTVSEISAGSPAAAAGLRRGDVIESVDGTAVSSVKQVVQLIRRRQPGQACHLVVERGREHLTVVAVLGRLG